MAYTFKQTPYGTVEVYENGIRVTTTTPQNAASSYGYGGSVTSTPTTTGSTSFGAVNTQPAPTYSEPAPTTQTSSAYPGGKVAAVYENPDRVREQNLIDYLNYIGRPPLYTNGRVTAPPGVNIVMNSNGTVNTQQSTGKQTLVTLGDGSKVYIDSTGQAFDAITGAPRSNTEVSRATAAATATKANDLNSLMEDYLQKMEAAGMMLNPNITIDATTLQEFAALAAKEIDPFYAEQLRTGVSDFLLNQGMSKDALLENEKRLSRKYGIATRQLGEQAADQGFAQSGIRRRDERELALDTQNQINDQRTQFQNQRTVAGRNLEKVFGSQNVPSFSLGDRPTVGAGESKFGTSPDSPLYNLSDSLYGNIKGSNTYEQIAAKKQRESELAGLYRSGQSLSQIRALTL